MDQINSGRIRKLIVELKDLEAKGIKSGCSDELSVLSSEDTPLSITTKQLNDKSGNFSMWISGDLDSTKSPGSGGGASSQKRFIGIGSGKIECNNSRMAVNTSSLVITNEKIPIYDLPINFATTKGKALGDLVTLIRTGQGPAGYVLGVHYYEELTSDTTISTDLICAHCLNGTITIRSLILEFSDPYITIISWSGASLTNVNPQAAMKWGLFYNMILNHEKMHHKDFIVMMKKTNKIHLIYEVCQNVKNSKDIIEKLKAGTLDDWIEGSESGRNSFNKYFDIDEPMYQIAKKNLDSQDEPIINKWLEDNQSDTTQLLR